MESDRLPGQTCADNGFTPDKLRDLHFDMLVAPTARFHGARLITCDHADFEMISAYRRFQLEMWQPQHCSRHFAKQRGETGANGGQGSP